MEIEYIGLYMVISSVCIFWIYCVYRGIKTTIDSYKRRDVGELAGLMLYWFCTFGVLLMICGVLAD